MHLVIFKKCYCSLNSEDHFLQAKFWWKGVILPKQKEEIPYIKMCSLFGIQISYSIKTLFTQDVIWKSFQRFLNVMDVRWTLKQCCVITGLQIPAWQYPVNDITIVANITYCFITLYNLWIDWSSLIIIFLFVFFCKEELKNIKLFQDNLNCLIPCIKTKFKIQRSVGTVV